MFARVQSRDCPLRVRARRERKIEQFDFVIVQQRFDVGCGAHAAQIERRVRADIAFNAGARFQPFGIGIADRDNLGERIIAVTTEMGLAHETQTDNSDFDHNR